MMMTLKHPTLFLLFAITAFNGYGQEIPYQKYKTDTTIPKDVLFQFKQKIYNLKEKTKLQQYEIRVLKELGKTDSVSYGKDSLITLFTATTGLPLMRVIQKNRNLQNNIYEDSIVFYYNKNGLVEYSEMWEIIGQKNLNKMKLTCRRYEYDDQNRVIRYVANFPTPRTMEWRYTYDSAGKVTRDDGQTINSFNFWDEMKKTSSK